jgi:uncharacterized membrane protein YjjB (DUF3815 family)
VYILANIELVILSFFASLGFGIVFQIRKEDLIYAALGGALIRIVYLICMALIPYRIVYVGLAAFCASLYAEILAYYKKMPATVFLYPSIVPLIPGDLFYYSMGAIISSNMEQFLDNAGACVLALLGISIGFVVCSSVMHYTRQKKIRNIKA